MEERSDEEVLRIGGTEIAPPDASVWNPAFDITPGELITGFITEVGVIAPPFRAAVLKGDSA